MYIVDPALNPFIYVHFLALNKDAAQCIVTHTQHIAMHNVQSPQHMQGGHTLDGTIRRASNMNEVHFERHFDAPVESLWQFIADPKKLEKWMGGPVDKFELVDGGNVVIQIGPRF